MISDSSGAWGADESWQLSTLAGSPKPRCNSGPKGAIQSIPVQDQPMETIEGGGDKQAITKRGKDTREDLTRDGSLGERSHNLDRSHTECNSEFHH